MSVRTHAGHKNDPAVKAQIATSKAAGHRVIIDRGMVSIVSPTVCFETGKPADCTCDPVTGNRCVDC